MGQKLIYVPECHSTNSALTDLVDHADLPEGTSFVTSHQTRGRGQRGNRWESGQGENLTFSVLLRPRFLAAMDQFRLNMAVTLGIVDALEAIVPEDLAVKWPNDILVGSRKIGGVLIENQSQGQQLSVSVIGIGLNVNQPEMTVPGAASLIQVAGGELDLNDLYQRLLIHLEARYIDLRAGGFELLHARYLERLYRYRQVQHFESDGRLFLGTIIDVDESGRLCVRVNDDVKKYTLKEIRMVLSEN